jgi:hypothetical protein
MYLSYYIVVVNNNNNTNTNNENNICPHAHSRHQPHESTEGSGFSPVALREFGREVDAFLRVIERATFSQVSTTEFFI